MFCTSHCIFGGNIKQLFLDMASLPTKKETQHIVDLFGFWGQYIFHLGVLLCLKYQVTQKADRFVWGLQQGKALQQAQDALPLGLYLPVDLMVVEAELLIGRCFELWGWSKGRMSQEVHMGSRSWKRQRIQVQTSGRRGMDPLLGFPAQALLTLWFWPSETNCRVLASETVKE